MKRMVVLLFALCLMAGRAHADAGCGIIFGSDWAFAFSAPVRWTAQCSVQQTAGAAVTLWPQGTLTAAAPAMMYVTVSAKNRSLALFAADAQQRLRSDKPNLAVRFVPGMSIAGGRAALVFRATDARNHELIAYVEGPTRFFVVVMSARSEKSLEEYRGAFKSLLSSFVPMRVTAPPS